MLPATKNQTSAATLPPKDFYSLPETGFVKIWQIVGDKKRNIPPVLPVSRRTFLEGVKSGRFPPSIKLGARSVAWRVGSIRALIEALEAGVAA